MTRETQQTVAPLTFVMGVERSGTTALFRSLAGDSRLTSYSEGEGPLYDARMYLRPETDVREFLQQSAGPILTKPLNETTTRGLADVLNEFAVHRPRLVWIYRDPVNVYHSWMVERWAAGAFVSFFVHQWNARHRRLLAALGAHGRDITLVRYEDLVLDPRVWLETRERVSIDGKSLFRPDSRAGRLAIPPPLQDVIDAGTLDVWNALEKARTFRSRALRVFTQEYGRALRRDEQRRQTCGRAAATRAAAMAPQRETTAAPRSPADVPSLVLWLEARAIPAAAEGSEVTVWPASSGPDAVRGPGRQGGVRSTPFANGSPAVWFPPGPAGAPDDAMAGFVCGGARDWRFLYDGSPWTILAVYRWHKRRSSFAGHALVQVADGRGGEFGLGVTLMDSQVCAILGTTAPVDGVAPPAPVVMAVPPRIDGPPDEWRVATCVHHPLGGAQPGRMAISSYMGQRLVGVAEKDPQCAYSCGDGSTGLHIGYSAGPTVGAFSGEIAEVVVFARALDDEARAAVVSHLTDKHGLVRPYTEPGSPP